MRIRFLTAFLLASGLAAIGQTTKDAAPGLPHNPRELLAVAAPLYDFTNASLKPWHLMANYQLYDDAGKPTGEGTYEYWWASPQLYRSTWTRGGASQTDWHTADGKHAYKSGAGVLDYFEFDLESALLSPLPSAAELDPAKFRLDRQTVPVSNLKLPCVMVVPLMPQHGQLQVVPLGLFPTYCFDSTSPVLRVEYSWGTIAMEFNKIVKVQGRYLAREILFYEGKRKILTATVDAINGISPSDPALTPAPDALEVKNGKVDIAPAVSQGFLQKKQTPIYPQDAKDARVSGKVVLEATIGRDGGVHELHVISAPWPSLVASALWAVSHWQYKPYLLNGEPVEVDTTINVIYSLGQ